MNVAIIGSRDFYDYELLKSKITTILAMKKFEITKIISGGARGADKLGERFAREHNISTEIIIPDWNKLGKKAGILRNTEIIQKSDIVFAFWDGKSPGTADGINKAKILNKQLFLTMI